MTHLAIAAILIVLTIYFPAMYLLVKYAPFPGEDK